MISGQHLPKPGERKKGEVIDPYVVIQLAGVGDDCKRVMTKAVNDNGVCVCERDRDRDKKREL